MISALLETCVQALRLVTFSALPVPMLRQVYLQGFYGLEKGVFARDVLQKSALSLILGAAWTSWGHLGRSSGHLGPSWAHLGPSWAHLGPSWAHLAQILGLLGPFRNHLVALLGLCFSFVLTVALS